MTLSDISIREHISRTVMERLDQDLERRREALRDYLSLTMPNLSETTSDHLATMVPTVLPDLYAKWIAMFTDRLLETVPRNQLEFLCDGSEENSAALILIYIMFLESERMEQQIEDDLKAYGLEHSTDPDAGGIVADYLRAKVEQLRASVGGNKG
ncbi:hypothetical protein [Desulfoplanes formicivorans]|uniref:Uncharacterized protein n=1 Tax=Desulfoplanes formicivorans TaxID=1592317 RepID=A0A194AG48_9BACT|nr:hypothetical protein [Desulfoplanes formicivorans]GAU08180.1 hypothetical protein DPF_0883 [Desulfoplanes formicivorans]